MLHAAVAFALGAMLALVETEKNAGTGEMEAMEVTAAIVEPLMCHCLPAAASGYRSSDHSDGFLRKRKPAERPFPDIAQRDASSFNNFASIKSSYLLMIASG